jgi:hypothetical protein
VSAAVLAAPVLVPTTVKGGAPSNDTNQQVRLSWVDDPSTTMTIRWRNTDPNAAPSARFRALGAAEWTNATGSAVSLASGAGSDFQVEATGLAPGATYEYQLLAAGDVWSEPRQFTTAPPPGGEFSVAFVADTGVSGRLDGLTAGTDQVLAAIDAIDPLFVLGGGDYAYADNDSRFASPAAGLDAWLDMMSPLISHRPFMPTYGNHEVLLEQSLDTWVERFATPDDGFGGRTSYSFDVAGVHFVSLLAYEGVLPPETLDWLTADLEAATARGVRTIVPYMHRNVYGDGTVHPPSPTLGRQLSALFDQYPVDVVLTAHDQSYERTFPLTGGTPTTAARRCYTPADGTTWIKSSPGGKLSNVSSGFSSYSATPPSPVIAVRDNALYHFSVLSVRTDAIEVTTYGIAGDDSPPVEVDRVSYRASCPTELAFTSLPVSVDLGSPTPTAVEATLSPPDVPVQLSTGAAWASATLGQPGQVSIVVDPTQLLPGRHATQIVASAEGYESAVLPVAIAIPDPNAGPELVLHPDPARGAETPLQGARLSGDVHIALRPPVGAVESVEFILDGVSVRTENQPPFDLVGGDDSARPFDTTTLTDGPHTLEAVVVGSDGTQTTASAQFDVANAVLASVPEATTAPGSATTVVRGRPVRAVTPVGGDNWWGSPLALVAGALLVGLTLGLVGRIRGQRPPSAASGESINSSLSRAYEEAPAGKGDLTPR